MRASLHPGLDELQTQLEYCNFGTENKWVSFGDLREVTTVCVENEVHTKLISEAISSL
jgi:hypothetical protein